MLSSSGPATVRRTAAASSAAVVLSSREIERMRGVVLANTHAQLLAPNASEQEYDELLRAARKAASDARAGRWPNTLAAMRRRKAADRAARLVSEEEAKVVMDEEEERLREQERLATLERATVAFVESTDRMKMLRTAKHASHVMDVRERQIALAKTKRTMEEKTEAEFQASLHRKLAEHDAKERAEAEARARARAEVAREQKQQLDEFIHKRILTLEAHKAEGQRIAAAAAAAAEEEASTRAARRARVIAANHDMAAANEQLREYKDQLRKVAAEEDERLRRYAETKAAEAETRAAIVQAKRSEALRKAAVMSETMTRDFMARMNNEESRVAAAVAEAQAKADALDAYRRQRQRQMHADIAAHRKATHEREAAAKAAAAKEAADQAARFESKMAALSAWESADAEERRARAKALQEYHVAQMADKKRRYELASGQERAAAALATTLAAGSTTGAVGSSGTEMEANTIFAATADALLAEERAKGHNTNPLIRSIRRTLREPLIAATEVI